MTDISKISDGITTYDIKDATARSGLSDKQDALVSGTNIKTINNQSILGEGNLSISGGESLPNQNINTGAITPLKLWQGTQQQWTNGEATTWYYWQTNVTTNIEEKTFSSTDYYNGAIVIGDVYIVGSNSGIYRSTDGINWSLVSTYKFFSSTCSRKFAYDSINNIIVMISSSNYIYSTDLGLTWNNSQVYASADQSIIYGNGKFVAINASGTTCKISTDGINWSDGGSLPSRGSSYYYSMCFGNGKFVAITANNGTGAYSSDGVTWYQSTLPDTNYHYSLCFDGTKFISLANSASLYNIFISTDGITWTKLMPSFSTYIGVSILRYSNGLYVGADDGTARICYSTDGSNWTVVNTNSRYGQISEVYDNGKFLLLGSYSSNNYAYVSSSSLSCYTLDTEPMTSSIVYSAPSTASALTVSSVTSGAITLSNNNTYYYNQSGNAFTYRTIGDAHPDWLCNINNVGVKIGNDTIATVGPDTTNMQTITNLVTSVSSSSTDSQYPSAKLFYDTVGDIEGAINTIRGV